MMLDYLFISAAGCYGVGAQQCPSHTTDFFEFLLINSNYPSCNEDCHVLTVRLTEDALLFKVFMGEWKGTFASVPSFTKVKLG